MTFDNGLRPLTYDLQKTGNDPVMEKSYQYYADGRLKFVGDEINGIFDRGQTFDHQGRTKEGKSSTEASGTPVTEDLETQLPYRQTYAFDVFGNMTQRNNLHWGKDQFLYSGSFNLNYTYVNNRITNQNWGYDEDGRVRQSAAPDQWGTYGYDARGLLTRIFTGSDTRRYYDGDGREVKRGRSVFVETSEQPPYGHWEAQDDEYFIRSTVLGGAVVSEVGHTGKKKQTFVYAGGAKIATQTQHVYQSTTYKNVSFDLSDASGLSQRTAMSNGYVQNGGINYDGAPVETDPMGGNVGVETPYVEEPPAPPEPAPDFPAFEVNAGHPVYVDGLRVSTMNVDGMTLPYAVGMGLIGFSANISCMRAPAFVNPYFRYQEKTVLNDCMDYMTLANHGIYRYASTPVNDVPGRDEYMFSNPESVALNNPPDLIKLRAAVNHCAEKWHKVRLKNVQWSGQGVNGMMEFEVLNGGTVNVLNPDNTVSTTSTFSIGNITTAFTMAQLGERGQRALGIAPRPPESRGTKYYGIMSWPDRLGGRQILAETNTTYTGTDREDGRSQGQIREGAGLNISGFIHTQIHETGNALRNVTGVETLPDPFVHPVTGERMPYRDNDPGQGFENCVLIDYKSRMGV